MIERGELGPDDRVGLSGTPRRLVDLPAFADAVNAATRQRAAGKAAERAAAVAGNRPSPLDTIPSEPKPEARGESGEAREARLAAERREKEERRRKALRDIERRKQEQAAKNAPQPREGFAAEETPLSAGEARDDESPAAASFVHSDATTDPSERSAETSVSRAVQMVPRSRRSTLLDLAESSDTDGYSDNPKTETESAEGDAGTLKSSEESAPIEIPKGGFPAEVIKLSGLELRKTLLASPIEEILGLPVTSSRSRLMDALHVRKTQLDAHRDAETEAVAQRLGLIDSRRILIAAYEVVRDPRSVREYMSAARDAERGLVSFEEFVPFEKSLHDPTALGRAQAAIADKAHALPAGTNESLDSQTAGILDEAEMLVMNLRERAKREKQIEFDKLTPQQRARRRRLQQISSSFQAVAPAQVGTTTSGPLSYGVGDAKTGLMSVALPFLILFGGILLLMIGTRFDQFETRFDERSPLGWIRAGMMAVLAIASMRLLRRESLSRLGWKPHWKPGAVTLLMLSPLLFFVCAWILPFEIKGEPAVGMVIAIIVARAFSEALFFEGFLHRTLLVEMPNALAAHFISMAAYVAYMNTYRFLWDPENPQHAGALLYGLFMALPAGYVFYRTRSWPVAAVVRLACLFGTALAASNAASIV